jgi:ankyrin repeat protein
MKINQNMKLLADAVLTGDINQVNQMIKTGSNVNEVRENSFPALLNAVRIANLQLVELLVASGAHLECRSPYVGETPLHYTALENMLNIMEFLINAGSDVNSKTPDFGATPLNSAATLNNLEATNLLIKYNADVNVKDSTGDGILHQLVMLSKVNNSDDYIKMFELLLKNGANPNLVNNVGYSALHKAAYYGQNDIFNLLLSYGATLDLSFVVNNERQTTPFGYTASECSLDFALFLLELGSNPLAQGLFNKTILEDIQDRKDPEGKAILDAANYYIKKNNFVRL